MSHQLNSYPSIFTNWLLHLTLFWLVFLFSGYVDSDYLTLPATPRTELVESETSFLTNFSFLNNSGQLTKQPQKKFSFTSFEVALIVYNQLQKVKFLASKEKVIEYALLRFYLPRKIIINDSKDANLSLFIG